MNRKEVRDFVTDRKNWKSVNGNNLIRFTILTVGDLQFARVETLRVFKVGGEEVMDFLPEGVIYEIKKTHKCVEGITFESFISRVWKEFKKQEETK